MEGGSECKNLLHSTEQLAASKYSLGLTYVSNASTYTWVVDVQDDQYSAAHNFHAVLRNSLLGVEKCVTARFLLHLYLIQGFLDSFLILPFIKQ